jgi:hypothetical protein
MSQTEVTSMFSKTGENGWPMANFAYRFKSSFVVKSISILLLLPPLSHLFDAKAALNR